MAPRIPRVLIIHSVYRTSGGEERMVQLEEEELLREGYQTKVLLRSMPLNSDLQGLQQFKFKVNKAVGLFRSKQTTIELEKVLQDFDPWTVHFHNIMPHWGYGAVSTALNWALRKGRNVVSTIHNQRWACANGLFFRNGKHCQLCYDRRNPLWGGLLNCRGQFSESVLYSAAITSAWMQNIYNHPSHSLIALNNTTAQRLRCAFPAAQIEVLPNPVVTGFQQPSLDFQQRLSALPPWNGRQTAVIGRLSEEKGIYKIISEILRASEGSPAQRSDQLILDPHTRFLFAGSGPLEREVVLAAKMNPRIIHLGRLPEHEVPLLLQTTGSLFHAGLVEEQSPTVIRMAVALKIPIFTYTGRFPQTALQQWGPLLAPQEWTASLIRYLKMENQLKP